MNGNFDVTLDKENTYNKPLISTMIAHHPEYLAEKTRLDQHEF